MSIPGGFESPEVTFVESWNDYSEILTRSLGEFFSTDYVFRGQRSSEHRLESSFDRRFKGLSSERRRAIARNLEEVFRDTALRNEIISSERISVDLGLCQHYGLATRLLDWSESRYVAAFFAFAGLEAQYLSSLDAEADDHHFVSVFALDVASPVCDDERLEVIRPEYSPSSDRLRRQRGLFTLNKTEYSSLEEYSERYLLDNPDDCKRAPLVRFDIPVSEARKALRDLHEMRISHSELFPGFEGVAKETMLAEWLSRPLKVSRKGVAPGLTAR